MSAREDEIRRVVAELDAHLAEVEARVAVLKALLADGEVPGEEAPWAERLAKPSPSGSSSAEESG
jgi:hypothetical protein